MVEKTDRRQLVPDMGADLGGVVDRPKRIHLIQDVLGRAEVEHQIEPADQIRRQ
jgi:hypothetical protein